MGPRSTPVLTGCCVEHSRPISTWKYLFSKKEFSHCRLLPCNPKLHNLYMTATWETLSKAFD